MSKYKLTFKLKQHTPIIHFQHDQHGATLRATELKPKLDRFLIEKLDLTTGTGDNERPKDEYKSWFINQGKEHLALDYKVRVELVNKNFKTGDVVLIPPIKDPWILSEGVMVYITSFKNKLLDLLKDNTGNPSALLKEFFVLHNFGKRQSKGFGCFYTENTSNKFLENTLKQYNLFKRNSNLEYEPYNDINNPNFFYSNLISKDWHRLKSGKNHKGYEKSRIFEYLSENDLRWDKRWIKRQLKILIDKGDLPNDLKYDTEPIDINDRNSWEDVGEEEYRYGRAMLGLAEHYEFLTTNSDYKYQVIIDGGSIERFKSPITFKIFNKGIYTYCHNVNDKIFNQTFKIKIQKKIKNGREFIKDDEPIEIEETIITPNLSEFNLSEFCEKYFPTIGYQLI